jgi:ankyrin repeat protein
MLRATLAGRYRLTTLVALLMLSAAAVAGAESLPLIEAARNQDREALRALVKKGVDVNAAEGDGATALHWASYHDDVESVDLLIRAGARVNAVNDLGVTALWNACVNASAPMVRRLLEAGAKPDAALLAGETPLMAASRSGNPEVVEQLLAKGANANVRAARGQTPLMWAIAQKHAGVVKVLLAHRADVHAKSDVWKQMMAVPPHGRAEFNRWIPQGGDTALMFAARVGDLESAKLLVAAGANVNDADAWGVSATAMAAHSGFTEVVEFLLAKGANPNAGETDFAALHAAIMRRDEKMASALLAAGADPNAPVRNWTPTRRSSDDFNFPPALVGARPFWLAARFGQPNLMRLLAKHGADPLVVHRSEYYAGGETYDDHRIEMTTALMAATGMGGGRAWVPVARGEAEALTLEAAKIAIELGIDVNAANLDGRTALDGARALKYESVVNFLIEHGATPGTSTRKPASPRSNR